MLWVPEHLLEAMVREANAHAPNETGGVLLGFWATETGAPLLGADAVVTAVVGPGPLAHHSRYAFSPDHDFHEREIARLYENSGRRWQYLGDWHSHPDGTPTLSAKDLATMGRIAGEPTARAPLPVMLVLVGGSPWRPYAWAGSLQTAGRPRWWRPRVATASLPVTTFAASD